MSLSAFTNQPGEHIRYDRMVGYIRGRYFGGDTNDTRYDELVGVEYCAKWFPTPGYAGCTDWFRRIQKITSNVPAQGKRFVRAEYGLGEPSVNLTYDADLRADFGPAAIFPPNELCSGCENSYNASITKALNNLTQHYAGIGADLGQQRQTVDMFAGAVIKAANFLYFAKQLRFADALKSLGLYRRNKSLPKTLADLWLEYSYGWKPLAADVYELQQAVIQACSKPLPIMAHATDTWSNSLDRDAGHGADVHMELKQSNRTYLEANVSSPALLALNQTGLINPLSIAWELVPFSFVVDWFIPVGSTLQAITAGVGLTSNGGWTSVRTEFFHELKYRVYPIADPDDFNQVISPGHLRWDGYESRRWCHADFPSPKLYADVTPYSTPRALNAIALLEQLV
jgi:hypothetical protein